MKVYAHFSLTFKTNTFSPEICKVTKASLLSSEMPADKQRRATSFSSNERQSMKSMAINIEHIINSSKLILLDKVIQNDIDLPNGIDNFRSFARPSIIFMCLPNCTVTGMLRHKTPLIVICSKRNVSNQIILKLLCHNKNGISSRL